MSELNRASFGQLSTLPDVNIRGAVSVLCWSLSGTTQHS